MIIKAGVLNYYADVQMFICSKVHWLLASHVQMFSGYYMHIHVHLFLFSGYCIGSIRVILGNTQASFVGAANAFSF